MLLLKRFGCVGQLVLGIVLMLSSSRAALGQQLQIVPTLTYTPQAFLNTCLNVTQWPTVYAKTTYLGSKDNGLDQANPNDLQSCFNEMRSRGLQLTIETGILNPFNTGSEAYQFNAHKWHDWIAWNAPLNVLSIDTPLTHGLAMGKSYSSIVQEVVNWMILVRNDPYVTNVKIMVIEAFPIRSAATIINFVNDVNATAASVGLVGANGLNALQIDHAWDGTQGGWNGSDMAAMKNAVHNQGMEFSMMFFASCESGNPNCNYVNRLASQWNAYLAYGINSYPFRPDIYNVQSFGDVPTTYVPESSSNTFTNGVNWLIGAVENIPTVHGGPSCPSSVNVSLQAVNGEYVAAENGGGSWVNANRPWIGSWETYGLVDHNGGCIESGDQVSFRTADGSHYLQAAYGGGNEVNGWGGYAGVWETFTIIRLAGAGFVNNGDAIALRSYGGVYVVAEQGVLYPGVYANRESIGAWETFTFVIH